MQLVELLRELNVSDQLNENRLDPTWLRLNMKALQECDEFKECNLQVVDMPIFTIPVNPLLSQNKTISTMIYNLQTDTQFVGTGYIYQILLSPKVIDAADLLNTVKDGCLITPIVYDTERWEPNRKIVMSYDTEVYPEFGSKQYPVELIREKLHEQLDKILDNPTEFLLVGKSGIQIRGYFTFKDTGNILRDRRPVLL